jgi:hypothetical protein
MKLLLLYQVSNTPINIAFAGNVQLGTVAGFCEIGNEPSDSINAGDFLNSLLTASQGLCSIQLVTESKRLR